MYPKGKVRQMIGHTTEDLGRFSELLSIMVKKVFFSRVSGKSLI
jgi:hypothetical protein